MARLLEHQVKDILQGEGFIIPARRLCHTPDEVRAACVELGAPVYVKAQVLAGDRAAGGGVRRCESPDDAAATAQALLGSQVQGLTVDSLLVESATVGQWEGYASVALEENPPRRVLRFSRTGGAGFDPSQATVQLDLVDAVEAHRVRRALVAAGTPSEELVRLTDALVRLAQAAERWCAYTLELNPIVLTDDGVVPLDAKADLDDYSKALIPDPSYMDHEEKDPRELAARVYQAGDHRGSLRYVQLIPESEGFGASRVASHSVGGGESMVVLDALDSVGLHPTNYCDTSGSPSAAKVATAATLVAGQSHISGLLFSTCIANQPLSVTAEGLLEGWRTVGWTGPTVVRFAGNQADQARDMVRQWAAEVGAPVRVVGEETDEWAAAQLLADLLDERRGSTSGESA